jgi:hypothetical protein
MDQRWELWSIYSFSARRVEGSYFWINWVCLLKSKGHRAVSERLNVRPASKRLRAAGNFGDATSKNSDKTLPNRRSDLHFLF